jgi:hypothetical protein
MKLNKLTFEESQVIDNKGTEPPFSGKYNDHKAQGTYTCKNGQALMTKYQGLLNGCWTQMVVVQKLFVQDVVAIWGMFLKANTLLTKTLDIVLIRFL